MVISMLYSGFVGGQAEIEAVRYQQRLDDSNRKY